MKWRKKMSSEDASQWLIAHAPRSQSGIRVCRFDPYRGWVDDRGNDIAAPDLWCKIKLPKKEDLR